MQGQSGLRIKPYLSKNKQMTQLPTKPIWTIGGKWKESVVTRVVLRHTKSRSRLIWKRLGVGQALREVALDTWYV